ncbi:MAG: hypoxanthine-guanine phosphoribosyltransferase, partial [Dechloromonas sp.]|nr:hypoxanthine-guanine phosphoribosyltransferase [Dechloromonas sp.]
MDLQKARTMLENAEVIHDEATVQRAVDEVAAAICAR